MSAPSLPAPQPRASIFHMYRALVGVGILCGLTIVTVYELTKPIIAENRAEALRQAVFAVIPDAASSRVFRATDEGDFVPLTSEEAEKSTGELIYAGYDEEGELAGVALEARGMGYADVIKVLYGYSFEKDAIVGMKVLESKETPGLGDKIAKDEDFLANFERLDVSLSEGGRSLAHPVVAVKPGEKEHPWQVDGITGATISSVAIADMLHKSAERWVPELEAHRSAFVLETSDHD